MFAKKKEFFISFLIDCFCQQFQQQTNVNQPPICYHFNLFPQGKPPCT
jgi:hypothetical protein